MFLASVYFQLPASMRHRGSNSSSAAVFYPELPLVLLFFQLLVVVLVLLEMPRTSYLEPMEPA